MEDNPADVYLFKTALSEVQPDIGLFTVPDGNQALQFIYRRGDFQDSPGCDLVLLDLNLPGLDGHHFLEIVRTDHELRHVPVAVFSSSRLAGDITRAYSEGANAYYRKRGDYPEMVNLIRTIVTHWFEAAQLPEGL